MIITNTQFTAVIVLTLLTLVLAVLPQRAARQRVVDRSRWLMAAGTGLLAVQFLLQYKLRLRDMGVTQAVMLNLPFFILASTLLLAAVLSLQRRSGLRVREWLAGGLTWLTTMTLIATAALTDGQPLMSDTPQIRTAEVAGGLLYILMQGYYVWLTATEMRRMRKSVAAYYDRSILD